MKNKNKELNNKETNRDNKRAYYDLYNGAFRARFEVQTVGERLIDGSDDNWRRRNIGLRGRAHRALIRGIEPVHVDTKSLTAGNT